MARRALPSLLLLIFFICLMPKILLAARLELRQSSTQSTDAAALVGQEFEVEVWVDSEDQPLSGAAVFLSFDEEVFALVDRDRVPGSPGFQPFAPGRFLFNGEVFRNALLDPADPEASPPGAQLDYSVVRALDQGAGPLAAFRLRAKAPSAGSLIRIDESGIRETRCFTPDGNHQPFRFVTPLRVTVKGISLDSFPSRLVLRRGQVDSTTFRLDGFVFDPLYRPGDITWNISPSTTLALAYDPQARSLRIGAPASSSAWEQLVFTATNPDGQSASATTEVFVAAGPVLPDSSLTIALAEDQTCQLDLDSLVQDPDTPLSQLQWRVSSPPELSASVEWPPHRLVLAPQPNWHGDVALSLSVTDELGFADTLQTLVSVASVDDPPEFLLAPNVRLTRSHQDSSLALAALVRDPESQPDQLRLSWTGAVHVRVEERQGRLVLGAPTDWVGTEQIQLQVEDPEGLQSTSPLTVTVVPSLPPSLIGAPERLGLVAGQYSLLELDRLVVDPDDPTPDLRWQISGQQQLRVQLSSSRVARVEAPADFAGSERLRFAVSDPSGESAAFDLLVFAAPASGAPAIAPLPEIAVPLGGVDASLDLDEYVFDLDQAPAQMEWFLPARDDVDLRVDPLTHVLTVAPRSGALAGPLELELRVRDPDGHESTQVLRLRLIGPTAAPVFSLASLSDVALEPGQTRQLDLDELVQGDVDPAQIRWQVEGQVYLQVELDSLSHQVQIRVPSGWSGEEVLLFVAIGPGGQIQRQSLRVAVTAPAAVPELAALPSLRLEAGRIDQSLDLDEFVHGVDPASLTWQVSGQQHLQALVDPQTHRLVLVPSPGWSGTEVLTLRGADTAGHLLEGALQVQVLPAAPVLTLRALSEVRLFAGESQIRLDLDSLFQGTADPGTLSWEAAGTRPVSVTYVAEDTALLLRAESPWEGSDLIAITVRDAQGHQATGHLLAQVYPVDGTEGDTIPEFRLAVLPNVLQPEYLDLFVLSDVPLARAPRLRLHQETWQDLSLDTSQVSGIWQSSFVLQPGQEGQVEFLALALGRDQQVLKRELDIAVGTARPASAKLLSAPALSVFLPAGAFARDAVVAVLPSARPDPGPELVPLSPAFDLHSSQAYRGRGGYVRMEVPASSRAVHPGLYRWTGGRWVFAGAEPDAGGIRAPLVELGVYALMDDQTPPRVLAEEEQEELLRLEWTDLGSGVESLALSLDGNPLSADAYTWDGQWLEVHRDRLGDGQHTLEIRTTDRAGNLGVVEKILSGTGALPWASLLGPNYPNPFNPATTIPFQVPPGLQESIRLDVYDAAGQRVRRLLDQPLLPGAHQAVWDARDEEGRPAASGVYLYRLQVGDQTRVRRMSLAR